MKRIVFATVGSLGDLHPYIAIGRALLGRGHRPVIATTDRYRVTVQAAGIEYAPLRPAEAQFGGLEAVAERLFDPIRGPGYLIREMVMPHLRDQYADLVQACTDAHLLVTHPLTLAGPLVCQKRGLPWASSVLAPISLMSCADPPLLATSAPARLLRRLGPGPCRLCIALGALLLRRWERPLDAFRRDLGLPRARQRALLQGQFSPLLNLALFPELIAAPQSDWPINTVLTGFARFDGAAADAEMQARLDAFLAAGEPPIVFALGSSVVMVAGDFWHKAIAATTRLRRRAILLTGGHWTGALPADIATFDYLPYSSVFPRAAAIVHQGGIGTFAQALSAGHPQLVVPLAFDQPDNARRAIGLGVARSIPIREATVAGLEEALSDLLSMPAYALAAERVASSMESGFHVGAERAADAILSVLG